jgi:hypothetical protein
LRHSAQAQPPWQLTVVEVEAAVVVVVTVVVVVAVVTPAAVVGVAVGERALPQCPEVARDPC